MGNGGRSPARFLAPAVLAAAVVVVVLVVTTSLGGDEPSTRTGAADGGAQRGAGRGDSGDGNSGESGPTSYEVQAGDTLGAIAEQTGVSVEQIQQLNPDVDPEALSTGQELDLRE